MNESAVQPLGNKGKRLRQINKYAPYNFLLNINATG
jgi:hypothetical protein